MVCPPTTEDYYMVLEVEQNAAAQAIVSSYRRLALKLHPDRNTRHDATEAFQRLGRAYETLSDETKRREYDRIYPSIRQQRASPKTAQTPRPSPTTSTPQAGTLSDAAQLAAIQKSKQERSARWRVKKSTFDSTIFELQRRIRQLEQAIFHLDSITAAEVAAEARKNSWGAWLLSPLSKKVEESEEDKEWKDRQRQERRIEKDIKERRLQSYNADLKANEKLLQEAKELVDSADRCDEDKIRVIEARIVARETRERLERERKERDKREKERNEAERQRRERAEKEWEEMVKEIKRAEKERQERVERLRQESLRKDKEREEKLRQERERQDRQRQKPTQTRYTYSSHMSTKENTTSPPCHHHGWWPKVQGRTNCPACHDSWTYLLQCPGCAMQRCPKCQAETRSARRRGRSSTSYASERTTSPDYYEYGW